MCDHLRTGLPLAALGMAISAQRPGAGLIHYSDRGVQYASADYRKAMQSADFKASMSRRAIRTPNTESPPALPGYQSNLMSGVFGVENGFLGVAAIGRH